MEIFDGVTVIGTGAAGMNAAIAAALTSDVLLLTDRAVGRSNSIMAQGGLQCPEDTERSRELMVRDIVRSAREPVDAARVESIAEHALEIVKRLDEWDVPIDRNSAGEYVRHMAGGLSEARVVSAGDHIGTAIARAQRHQVVESARIDVRPGSEVNGLRPEANGVWSIAVNERDRGQYEIRSSSVIAATGGTAYAAALRRQEPTTNPPNGNNVMVALLESLALPSTGSDSFQLHPFGVAEHAKHGVVRCVPERITRLGVPLLDRRGQRIAGESADRFEILAAIRDMDRPGGRDGDAEPPAAVLAMSAIDDTTLEVNFPSFYRWASSQGIVGQDLAVTPALHYQLGGFSVDTEGSTRLPNLYLAGEITGQVHGRNRLMGLGLTQSLVDGWTTGIAAGRAAARR